MSLAERFSVLRNIRDECIDEDELRLLLHTKDVPVCYVWFVPSPSMDLAQGIMKTIYVNRMVNAGCKVKILIADWFAQMNYQTGSDLNKIRTVGCYNIEVWKAAGMDLYRVELVWLSDVMDIQESNFWPLVTDIGQKNTVDGIKRCCRKTYPHGLGIMRDKELLLPCLQCAGMLFEEVDIWMLAMDQRDVSILARKYCEDIKRANKPVFLLNNILPDLLEYPDEAGVSDPAHALSIEDNEDTVSYKIMLRAFCPPQAVKRNPCLEYIKFIILPWFGKFEVVQRNGCQKIFTNMEKIIVDYKHSSLRAGDVKLALVKAINKLLQGVHEHFKNNTYAKDLLEATRYMTDL
ncbi:hypothetical protein ACQ4PT_006001 [Festuca glaucescens]